MEKKYKNLSKETKDKFLKMLLMLFPSFKSARFKSNGNIVFKQRGWFKRRIRTHFVDLLTIQIPRELCLCRYGNYSVIPEFYEVVKNISNLGIDKNSKIEKVVDYLYNLFSNSKIRDIYNNYDHLYNLEREDITIIENSNFTTLADNHKILISLVSELKLIAATWALTISLYLPFKVSMTYKIAELANEIRFYEPAFKIINSS